MKANRIKSILILFTSIALISCASTYEKNSEYSYGHHFTPQERFVIATPEDGYYGTDTYHNSGKMLRDVIYQNLVSIVPEARKLDDIKLFSEFELSDVDADYFIEPIILHWEDRNTEWSGKPDRVHILIQIYDIATGESVSKYDFSGKSKWATFGGDHPQDLLVEPIEEYVENLFY